MQPYTNHLWKLIESYPNKDWNWYNISCNPNITWNIIQDNQDKPWSWIGISYNPNITWEIIQDNPNVNWNWYWIPLNPNITWEIILNNPNNWDWGNMTDKPFLYITCNQKKAKRWIKNHIDNKCSCPTVIAELISDFVY